MECLSYLLPVSIYIYKIFRFGNGALQLLVVLHWGHKVQTGGGLHAGATGLTRRSILEVEQQPCYNSRPPVAPPMPKSRSTPFPN